MKKKYMTPMSAVAVLATDELLTDNVLYTSRYPGNGNDTPVKTDSGEEEPEPLAKYNAWTAWDEDE